MGFVAKKNLIVYVRALLTAAAVFLQMKNKKGHIYRLTEAVWKYCLSILLLTSTYSGLGCGAAASAERPRPASPQPPPAAPPGENQGQLRNIICPACPGSASRRLVPVRHAPKHLPREETREHSKTTSVGSSPCGGAAILLRVHPGWLNSPHLLFSFFRSLPAVEGRNKDRLINSLFGVCLQYNSLHRRRCSTICVRITVSL